MPPLWQLKLGGTRPCDHPQQVIQTLLRQRGIAASETRSFLEPRYHQQIHDPYLLANMPLAVDRIYQAIATGERVLVYGDYDVDGITSTAVMMTTLQDLAVKVDPFIPDRNSSGYGLSIPILEELLANFDLLITVDCGISSHRAVDWLRQKGKDVIITDHHSLPTKLPNAVAVIHPSHPQGHYPTQQLSGVAVSWKLATALYQDKRLAQGNVTDKINQLLDLVCLGTIADLVPLTGENRTIVKYGLKLLSVSHRPGLRALTATLANNKQLDVDNVSYRLAPLLNAAGRIDHAQPALDLLLAPNRQQAEEKLRRLIKLNDDRKKISQAMQKEAEQACGQDLTPVLFTANLNWAPGLVGLVAGRLCDRYGKPAVVVGGAGDQAVGSIRAPAGLSALKLLRASQAVLTKFGGHDRAAGFTLPADKLDRLQAALLTTARQNPSSSPGAHPAQQADLILKHELIGWDLAHLLKAMEPFGQGNEQPKFILKNIYLGDWRPVGKTGAHVKMAFNINDELVGGIGFNLAKTMRLNNIKSKGMVDIIATLEINEYNSLTSLQLKVLELVPASHPATITTIS